MAELDAPIVLTSGNLTDEPQAAANDEALARLARAFDATYGWGWKEAMQRLVKDGSGAGAIRGYYAGQFETWPHAAMRMVYTENHDQNSWDGVAAQIYGIGLIASRLTGVQFEIGILLGLGLSQSFQLLGVRLTWWLSGLGAHLSWTLPFGLLIMFAVFNRFDRSYEEAARDLGATPWQAFRHVVLPLIGPSVVGIGMFGFTLSWDEIARTSQAIGDVNTLPLELQGLTSTVTTPAIYALGTVTTVISFLVVGVALGLAMWLGKRQKKGM